MHLELVELLRCPVNHAPSVLVAAANAISNRYVSEGVLGCPECLAEYPITDGITQLDVAGEGHVEGGEWGLMGSRDGHSEATIVSHATSIDPMRLAAQLALDAGRSAFVLIGYDTTTMAALRDIVPARMLLLNSAQLDASAFPTERLQDAALVAPVGVATFGSVLPLMAGKFAGIAINGANPEMQLLDQCAVALRTGGRLVAHVDASIPNGLRELVRDDEVWVAERESVASAPIGLTRR